ncbi:bifunctional nuclease family protein [Allobranchiibius sp. GilTou38]|uniref:bifunctional nuclease family protein n=1 Tax=Allobranchiibius sp. GilTou38 TaxID=2815210 RepID=UPI001AA117C1|nr:bifunctional nuclease family protein [Allobranchiibius sp. GilTou38]MBO1766364.1 bifunctional nuclease family protein [Allobranchiibius sp. GilTou38]
MRRVDVMGVRVEMPTNKPIVLLRERDGELYVPIWIGAPEATAIAYAQQGVASPRPLTHDLLVNVLSDLGHTLEHVVVTRMEDSIFYAELVVDGDTTISARSSDAIAIALRAGVSIYVADEIFDEVGVSVPVEEDDEVEKFREFLDNVSAEDFETSEGEGPGEAPEDGPEDRPSSST